MILLDTHVLVALIAGSQDLGFIARNMIEVCRRDSVVKISPMSFWEVGRLVRKRRLDLGCSLGSWGDVVLAQPNVAIADITPQIAAEAGALPEDIHGDPGDRILIATARDLGCPLMTNDRLILDYAEQDLLQAIDARR